MIAYIEGRLLEKTQRSCVVVTNCGVGYELFLTERDLGGLGERGEQLFFHVATVVREDSITLYGFLDFQNRCLFNLLLSVPKLGPRTSLALLNFFTPTNLVSAVNRSDSQAEVSELVSGVIKNEPEIDTASAVRLVLKELGKQKS